MYVFMGYKKHIRVLLFSLILYVYDKSITTVFAQSNQTSEVNTYTVVSRDNICILMKASIKIIVPLKDSRRNISTTVNSGDVNTTNVDGFCEDTRAILYITWDHNDGVLWTISFIFHLFTGGYYSLDSIDLDYRKNGSYVATKSNKEVFSIPVGSYYNCTKQQKIELFSNNAQDGMVRMIFETFQVEAFRSSKETNFVGTESRCTVEDRDHVVTSIVVIVAVVTMALIFLCTFCLTSDETDDA
uniref:Lysosome-associated membrane glycoprotein 5 n=1 Tax=Trichobilharzia regenti TaxID=157069 RepID=A0AA85JHA9_TRIRE|nr:unnamed protein product [Trichobilharzia regenti]